MAEWIVEIKGKERIGKGQLVRCRIAENMTHTIATSHGKPHKKRQMIGSVPMANRRTVTGNERGRSEDAEICFGNGMARNRQNQRTV